MDNKIRISNWINSNLKELEQLKGKQGVEILHKCGRACCESSDLYQGAYKVRNENASETDMDVLFNAFKTDYCNSDNLTKEGNTLSLIFESCTCPLVKNGVNDAFLCNCTVGYSKNLFETLFDKQVTIDLEKSILRGDPICKQSIRILD